MSFKRNQVSSNNIANTECLFRCETDLQFKTKNTSVEAEAKVKRAADYILQIIWLKT